MSELIKGPYSKKDIEMMYGIGKGEWRVRVKALGLMRKMIYAEPTKSMKKKAVYFIVAKNLSMDL
jgi:hypothetical protein